MITTIHTTHWVKVVVPGPVVNPIVINYKTRTYTCFACVPAYMFGDSTTKATGTAGRTRQQAVVSGSTISREA